RTKTMCRPSVAHVRWERDPWVGTRRCLRIFGRLPFDCPTSTYQVEAWCSKSAKSSAVFGFHAGTEAEPGRSIRFSAPGEPPTPTFVSNRYSAFPLGPAARCDGG